MDLHPGIELHEELMDLAHDLGKYVRLPLAMLPADADRAQVVEAVREGIVRTRRGPWGITPARRIWEDFLGRNPGFTDQPGHRPLDAAVSRVLELEPGLARDLDGLSRQELTLILGEIALRINDLLEVRA